MNKSTVRATIGAAIRPAAAPAFIRKGNEGAAVATPTAGDTYRQEYLPGEAEDLAKVLETAGSVTVRDTAYDRSVVTQDWTPLEPEIVEHKTDAPGIGVVLEELVQGGKERVELVRVEAP